VLVEAHSASLNLCFYTGDQFPAEYKGDVFAASHGSWNRMKRTGYKVVRAMFDKSTGKASGGIPRLRDWLRHARRQSLGSPGRNHRRERR
jgi:glucose/arabinose dehydrogenase